MLFTKMMNKKNNPDNEQMMDVGGSHILSNQGENHES